MGNTNRTKEMNIMAYGTMNTQDANQMLAYMRRSAQYETTEDRAYYEMGAYIIQAGY